MIYRKKLNHAEFKIMQGIMGLADAVHPMAPRLAKVFGVVPGMTVVDYGCGPGRYTVELAKLVEPGGKVFAVDLVEIALKEAEKRLIKNGISMDTVELKLAHGYDSGLLQGCADIVFAIDMFHNVHPAPFLGEAARIAKPDGALILSGGHQSRKSIKKAIDESGLWELNEETTHYMKYKKKTVESSNAN